MKRLVTLAAVATAAGLLTTPAHAVNVRAVEVGSDHRITFRLYAPDATEARVDLNGSLPMTKDRDGVWSVTSGPMNPDVYSYFFVVDKSLRVPDSQNTFKKNPGEDLVVVPSDPPALWQEQDVPHGSVHESWYPSKTLGFTRRVHVYTPPGYEASHDKYPVLYLLHGSGDNDGNWSNIGCAQHTLDNLIAQGKAKPMVVVMPYGHVPGLPGEGGLDKSFTTIFARVHGDFFDDMIPFINTHYRVRTDAAGRAMAGLSMGAMQSQVFALEHPGQFAYVGLFSGIGAFMPDLDNHFAALAANPAKANKAFKLVYVLTGDHDFLLDWTHAAHGWLTQHGITHIYKEVPGSHEWRVWREGLGDFVPLLFR